MPSSNGAIRFALFPFGRFRADAGFVGADVADCHGPATNKVSMLLGRKQKELSALAVRSFPGRGIFDDEFYAFPWFSRPGWRFFRQ